MKLVSPLHKTTPLYLAASYIPQLVMAGVLCAWTRSGWTGYAWFFGGLLLLRFSYWIIKSVVDWGLFWGLEYRWKVRQTVRCFQRHGFPEPVKYGDCPENYLHGVAQNQAIDIRTRSSAANLLSVLDAVREVDETHPYPKLNKVLEEALDRFKSQRR